MATREVTTATCDLHAKAAEATVEVTIIADGYAYEVDLCEKHAEQVAKFTAAATRKRRVAASPTQRPERRTTAARRRTAEIRQRAIEAGENVSARGRMPASLIKKYG